MQFALERRRARRGHAGGPASVLGRGGASAAWRGAGVQDGIAMSRYRPPTPRSSPYITPDGYRALGSELQDLWQRRREVVVHLTAAAAEGDRSENAEYIYRKKQLRELDRRIGYLQRRLPVLEVVAREPGTATRVYFGAWVTLCDEVQRESRFRIVGADEFDPERNWISVDAPMARALLGRAVDDEVLVDTPEGTRRWWIVAVDYRAADHA
jgi:transcription elongation factor GreB